MYLELTDEQGFLVEAATDALRRTDTLAAAREALDGAEFADLWPVAVEAGWTGLLSGEQVGGAGLGVHEALLVLEACGARLADARLLGHLPAVALLEAADYGDLDLRRSLAAGERRAAIVDAELGAYSSQAPVTVERDGEHVTLGGSVTHVLDAPTADVLVVTAAEEAVVIDAAAPGVTIEPQDAYDATRALASVGFDGARARPLDLAPAETRHGRDLQRALLAAESVGAASACLTMARAYAIDRKAFGRAIGSYQAIKHKLVEMMRLTEGARSLLLEVGRAWETEPSQFTLLANAARVSAGDALDFAAPENIFIHGGIGATWEHDAQLFYRRAELSRRLAGGAEAAAEEVACELLAGQPAPDASTAI